MKPSSGITSSLAGVIRSHPRYKGCIGHWRFDEGIGTIAYDHSGWGQHGTLTSGGTWAIGKFGAIGEFPSASYLNLGTTAYPFLSGTGPTTLTFWARVDAWASNGFLPFIDTTTTNFAYWEMNGPGNLVRIHTSTAVSNELSGVGISTYNDSVWRHYAFVNRVTTLEFYVDGVLRTSGAAAGASSIVTGNKTIRIGNYSGSASFHLDGGLDDMRLYTRALEPGEILSLFSSPFLEVATAYQLLDDNVKFPVGGTAYTLTAEQGSYVYTGQTIGLYQGYLVSAAQGSYSLAGQDVSLLNKQVILADQGSYVLNGQDVGLNKGYKVTSDQGSYSVAGQDVTLLNKQVVVANQGSYLLNGQDVTLLNKRIITIEQGSYNVTGQDVSLVQGYLVTAVQGSYLLNGQDVTLLNKQILTVDQGSYTLNGQDVSLTKGRTLTAAQGSYVLSGQAVTLLNKQILTAAQGSYLVNGQAVTLKRGFPLTVGQGSYLLNGQSISFSRTRVVVATQGSYLLNGQAVNFSTTAVFPRFGAISSGLLALAEGVVLGRLGGVLGFFSLKNLGVHVSTTASYSSGTGTAGASNTAQTVLSRTLNDSSLVVIGDRLRVRCHFNANSVAPIVLTIKIGPSGSEVSIASITYAGGTAIGIIESYVDYVDATHANITEEEAGVAGASSVVNQAGFLWTSNSSVIVTQDAVVGNFVTVYGLFVDVLPLGVM